MIRIIVYSIISIVCLVGAIFQFLQKGVPFTNEYNFESKDIRNRVDKKPFFLQGGVFLLYLALMFIGVLIQEINYLDWLDVLFKISLPIFIIYAIISSIKLEKLKKNARTNAIPISESEQIERTHNHNTVANSIHAKKDDESKLTIVLVITLPFIVAFIIIMEALSEVYN